MLNDVGTSPYRNIEPVELQRKVVRCHNQKVAQSGYNARVKDDEQQASGQQDTKKRARKGSTVEDQSLVVPNGKRARYYRKKTPRHNLDGEQKSTKNKSTKNTGK